MTLRGPSTVLPAVGGLAADPPVPPKSRPGRLTGGSQAERCEGEESTTLHFPIHGPVPRDLGALCKPSHLVAGTRGGQTCHGPLLPEGVGGN